MPKIIGIIPARYASTRFPGKPLAEIGGKTMIQRVYEQVSEVQELDQVIVATDDQRIENHIKSFGGQVMMTSEDHQSGTDRCAEVLHSLKESYDIVINIQGDEPFIAPKQIQLLCRLFDDHTVDIASLCKPIMDISSLQNPNVAKVVLGSNHQALYFSRQAIPYQRNQPIEDWIDQHTYYKHLGIYGYRSEVLKEVSQLPPSTLELAESLEQLRWLENGYKIKLAVTDYESLAVDTYEDLKRVEKYWKSSGDSNFPSS